MLEPGYAIVRLSAFYRSGGHCDWVLWVHKDDQSSGGDQLLAGRVKLQDDPIATTNAVLADAFEKTESLLSTWLTVPLF